MSSQALPLFYLARHGETAWSLSGQHTGRTDIPLTEKGESDARALGERLRKYSYGSVLTSPLKRARKTCELAGFGSVAVDDPDLMEWNYGDYDGRTTADIRKDRPGWYIFRDGFPGGESFEVLTARADRVVAQLRAATANVLIFSHGHFLRILTARWLGLPLPDARFFLLKTTSLSILGYERSLDEPVIHLWNDNENA